MTYDAQEKTRYSSKPYELYLWSTAQQQWFLTTGPKKITYQGHIYEPLAMVRTEIDNNSEAKSGGLKVTVPRTHELASLFLAYLPVSPLQLTIYRGHYGDADAEVREIFGGKIVSAKFRDFCELTAVPETYVFQQRVPAIQYQQQCPWITYGPGCNLDRSLFMLTGAVTALSADKLTITVSAFGSKPAGWLNAGYIEFGNQRRFINGHTGSAAEILDMIPGLQVGSVVFAYAGDMRNALDCIQKFNNYKRFMGFPNLPDRNPYENGMLGY
jgi:hypothetical protein